MTTCIVTEYLRNLKLHAPGQPIWPCFKMYQIVQVFFFCNLYISSEMTLSSRKNANSYTARSHRNIIQHKQE